MKDRYSDNELRNTTGLSRLEKFALAGILAVIIAICIPVLLSAATGMQLRINRANLQTVRSEARTAIQTGLSDTDSTTPDGRKISEGLAAGTGWVALAQVDKTHRVSDIQIFVVDEISDYKDGIAPGKVDRPVRADSDIPFYEEPDSDRTNVPFASVRPNSGGGSVYTVQIVVDDLEIDLAR